MLSPSKYILVLLTLVTALVWIAVLTFPDNNLHLIACDVGQGDAILTTYKDIQILVDGGPDNKVLDCLGRQMPFWDRQIEMVILTHQETDHFLGLVEVVQRYDVKNLIVTPLDPGGQEYQVLKDSVGGRGITIINPHKGLRMRLGLIYLEILNPSISDISLAKMTGGAEIGYAINTVRQEQGVLGKFTSKADANELSVVTLLTFGDFEALLTGDIQPEISDEIAQGLMTKSQRPIDYLKVPHHGSKNGLTRELVDATKPRLAVISVGKDNTFGHPHEEVLKLLSDKGIKILRTDELGDIKVETDGNKTWLIH